MKEDILFKFRRILDEITPDVIFSRLVTFKFVPVRSRDTGKLVHHCYVVKVIVDTGRSRELYTYKSSSGFHELAFRTENEVLKVDLVKDIHKVLHIYRERIEGLRPKPVVAHGGGCAEPETSEVEEMD